MGMGVRENLASLIDAFRTNPTALAHATGVPQPTIHRILTGESRDPRTATLAPLASYFGVSVSDLRHKDLTVIKSTARSAVLPAMTGSRRVPLLRYDNVTKGVTERPMTGLDVGEYLLTDQDLSARAFAVELVDASMLPDYRPGDRVICDPEIKPLPGDCVLAKHDEQTVFGKYRPRQDGTFQLVPTNDDYPTLDLSSDAIIATMAEHRRYRRR